MNYYTVSVYARIGQYCCTETSCTVHIFHANNALSLKKRHLYYYFLYNSVDKYQLSQIDPRDAVVL